MTFNRRGPVSRFTFDSHVHPEASQELWDDMRVSLSRATTGSNNPTLTTFVGGTQAYAFSATATNQLFFDLQLSHSWVAGSEIRPHIHWSPGNSTSTANVVWSLEYTWASAENPPNNTFPATSTLTVTDAAYGAAYAHQIAEFGTIDGTGQRLSSVLMCRVARLGGDAADTFAGVAFGLSVDFHIKQVQAGGSVVEYPR